MCVVSMIGDHYHDKWKDFPWTSPNQLPQQPFNQPTKTLTDYLKPAPTKQEFDALKKEVEEMKELLKKAVAYDERNNEPHCEIEEKIATLKRMAEFAGISLDDVFKK